METVPTVSDWLWMLSAGASRRSHPRLRRNPAARLRLGGIACDVYEGIRGTRRWIDVARSSNCRVDGVGDYVGYRADRRSRFEGDHCVSDRDDLHGMLCHRCHLLIEIGDLLAQSCVLLA